MADANGAGFQATPVDKLQWPGRVTIGLEVEPTSLERCTDAYLAALWHAAQAAPAPYGDRIAVEVVRKPTAEIVRRQAKVAEIGVANALRDGLGTIAHPPALGGEQLDQLLAGYRTTAGPPPPEPGGILTNINELIRKLPDPDTIPARIEVDVLAQHVLRTVVPTAEQPASPLAALTGVPVVVNADLPLGAWRVLNHAGDVLREGSVAPEPLRDSTPS